MPATIARLVILAAAVVLTAWSQWSAQGAPVRLADEWLRDRFIRLQASNTPETRILVVDIDEATLAAYPWPWPRSRQAELVERLVEQQPRGVALDIVMLEPGEPGGDARMATLAEHGPVVLAQLFDYNHGGAPLRSGRLIGGIAPAAAGATPATGYLANHAGLAHAAHAGNIGVIPDSDGMLRRIPMVTAFEGRTYPTLALALLQCCGPAPAPATPAVMRVPFRHTWDAFAGASAADVLAGRLPPELVTGKLVLVGSSALSVGDRVPTPLGPATAGLLVHAELLSALLDHQAGLAPASWPGAWIALAFSLLVAILVAWAFPRLSAASNVALLFAASCLWLPVAYAASRHDPDFSPGGPMLSNLLLLAVAVPFHWQLTQRKSRQLLGTLRQYVATAVVDELLRSDMKDPLAPRQLQVTTLIADMEGYTSQVEALPVEEAARLTTDFLDCLTRPVLARHGTLDKYTGDGLVAFWGAPLPQAEHADLALDAARDILREVAQFSRRRVAAGHTPLRVRIGIESGLAMAGDYGTALRSIYTAVGDSVNTAARLEQLARDFPHDVIIGAGTVERSKRHRFVMLGERQLRGKEKMVRLYTLDNRRAQAASAELAERRA
ncbi:adenylate/guanylate cyclase domain-containing protein [Massilia horti]|uniref:Adenylate/guanylate cyclase domain-containing protein n=2 Tax=Massilia horti TaxID=2562153 RepID=A0A4Y9TA48_9BURK|nr:adenylate/guanylate cyclase domain-containing protein [Massilia horti]